MSRKEYIFISLVVVLVGLYAVYFTDWFRPKIIRITHSTRSWRRGQRSIPTRSSRHGAGGGQTGSGGSGYAFADGSVRYFKSGKALWPLNLWAVTDAGRSTYAS